MPAELDRREADSEADIRPQRRYADMLVSFMPNGAGRRRADRSRRRADALRARPAAPRPDAVCHGPDGLTLVERDGEQLLRIPGRMDPDTAAAVEEATWERMHFATRLRARRLGELTIGTALHRSESLALVQLLVLYHLVIAKAVVALGGTGARTLEAA